MTPKQAAQLKIAIRQYVVAAIAKSWKGLKRPEEGAKIERDFTRCRGRVRHLIFMATGEDDAPRTGND